MQITPAAPVHVAPVNPGKKLVITYDGHRYERIPVKTHIITDKDNIVEVVRKYAAPQMKSGDILFISERIVAISQGRAFPISSIKPSPAAKFLVKFVHKSPHGIGLGSPWTMELAIREAGLPRIIIGALAAAITKPFGMRGVFYRVVGKNVNAIDGPCDYTLPPYDSYAKLGPADPAKVAREIKAAIGYPVAIVDANDLGVRALGVSDNYLTEKLCAGIFADNPLGQSSEQTPLCIVRRLS